MRLKNVRASRNIEDRRGRRISAGRGGGIGVVGLLLVLGVGWFTGIDVTPLLTGGGAPSSSVQTETEILSTKEQQVGEFSARVLATTEAVWDQVLPQQAGISYTPPVLVLFSQITQSPCGNASGATGPFYCPIDQKAYLDTAFFATMAQEMGAKGDFASAYVIAHEVAHHVQDQLGILGQARQLQSQMSTAEANAISVRIELQADCLSGVWSSYVENLLEPGDIDEALNAARKIGDDYLMRQAGRVPNPHSFTHGTSEQRQRWFALGYQNGEISACDTFSAQQL